MLNKFVFLIGSGLSCSAGLPSVDEVTNEIYSLDNTFKHSNNHFYKSECKPSKKLFPEYYEYNHHRISFLLRRGEHTEYKR